MKKILALALALMLCLCSVAFADNYYGNNADGAVTTQPDAENKYVDITSVNLSKTYTITNEDMTSPAETFNFKIEPESVSDTPATITKDNMPMPHFDTDANDYEGTISFAAGEATVAGDTNSTVITLPEYTSVGIYTYKITETAGTTAGVIYDTKPIYLKVTVIQQGEGKVRVAALHYETETGTKWESFDNEYKSGNLSVNKQVTGNLGDLTKYFKFTVTLTGETGKTYGSSYVIDYTEGSSGYTLSDGTTGTNPASIVVGTPTDIYLKHGETIVIENLPYGVTYTVTEDNVDYVPTWTWSDEEHKLIDSALDTVSVINEKTDEIDTGIALDNAPYMIVLALVVVAGVMMMKKRSYNA